MNKSEIKKTVMRELSFWWAKTGDLVTLAPAELAADQRVPVKLAKAALKDLHRAGKLYRCPGCGCYSLSEELLR